ncbi:nuclear transport factor 2 family protein [Micromonospora sp. HM134]|uniref:nuclear transport factor 2 family protein n=1 Tax=Micromonospora sp. HM134 TaxID=2583243 RepID=UPI001198398E|nr:nuclear transport factor 2 family protein [Micromonospora sp. HM134]QDY06304.1 nuclear transport factor 2 family protein [Micromonospora sp. HM134]
MDLRHQEIFQRYVYAGAVTRNPDAVAALFTEDGVYDAPLVPEGHPLHGRLVGREAIRAGLRAYHRQLARPGTVDPRHSTHHLHETADPDVFVAEIDVAVDEADGRRTTMSLVQVFRLRAGQIVLLRDYFTEPPTGASGRHPR